MVPLVLLWLSIAFVAGIAAAALATLPWLFFCLLFFVLFLFSRVLIRTKILSAQPGVLLSFILLLLGAFCAGGWRFQHADKVIADQIDTFHDYQNNVVLHGRVISAPQLFGNYQEIELAASQIQPSGEQAAWQTINGKVQVRLPQTLHIRYGDYMLLEGKLNPTVKDGEASYTSWLARQGIFGRMYFPKIQQIIPSSANWLSANIYRLHARGLITVKQLLPHPESALLAGILLGVESDIPDYLQSAYRTSGTAHIIAISGFNMALIAGIVIRLFRRVLPFGWSALAAMAAIALYTILVGANPAVLRAAIMSATAIPAYLLGRQVIGFHSLGLTAGLMTLFNPMLVWDVSFQLSFCATLGIMLFTDPLNKGFAALYEKSTGKNPPDALLGFLSDFVFATLAAQFGVLPVVLGHFQNLSLLSLPANLLILPVQALIMILGGMALIAGLLFLPFGKILGALVWFPLRYTNQVVLRFSLFPSTLIVDEPIYVWVSAGLVLLCTIAAIHQQFAFPKEIAE